MKRDVEEFDNFHRKYSEIIEIDSILSISVEGFDFFKPGSVDFEERFSFSDDFQPKLIFPADF